MSEKEVKGVPMYSVWACQFPHEVKLTHLCTAKSDFTCMPSAPRENVTNVISVSQQSCVAEVLIGFCIDCRLIS